MRQPSVPWKRYRRRWAGVEAPAPRKRGRGWSSRFCRAKIGSSCQFGGGGLIEEPRHMATLAGNQLRGILFGIEFLVKDMVDGWRFVGSGYQKYGVRGGQQCAREKCQTPLAHFRYIEGACDLIAIHNGRFTRKETGGVSV